MPFDYLSFDYQLEMFLWLIAGVVSFWILLYLRRGWKKKPWRMRIVHALLSVWMCLATFTLVELYFALIFDQTDSFNMSKVSQKWFDKYIVPDQKYLTFRSGEFTSYRDDREFPRSVPPDKHHICFIGDSFAFGHGVPKVTDRFSNRVSAMLQRKQPGRFVVSNLADAGRETYWVESCLTNLINSEYRVNTFIYVICLNDIETFDPQYRAYDPKPFSQEPKFSLINESYFLSFAFFRLKLFMNPDVKGYYSFVKEYYEGKPWQGMQLKLHAIHRLCQENSIDFRIVVFPFLHTLGPDYDFHHAHSLIVSFCRGADIPVLDLEPVLKPHVEEGLMVNRFDAHPNERAHELVAEAIRDKLLDDLIRQTE